MFSNLLWTQLAKLSGNGGKWRQFFAVFQRNLSPKVLSQITLRLTFSALQKMSENCAPEKLIKKILYNNILLLMQRVIFLYSKLYAYLLNNFIILELSDWCN